MMGVAVPPTAGKAISSPFLVKDSKRSMCMLDPESANRRTSYKKKTIPQARNGFLHAYDVPPPPKYICKKSE